MFGGREALTHFDELIAREPREPSFHYGRGLALSGLLGYREAVDALQHAVVLDPRHAAAFRQLAILYTRLNRSEAARAAYQKASALGRVPESERIPLARALRQSGLLEEARAVLKGAQSSGALVELGILEMERGDYSRAAEHLKVATAEPATSTASADYEYGRCLELLGEPEQAVTYYRRALEKEPGLSKARFRLGTLLQELGELEEGQALLRGYQEFHEWDQKVKLSLTKLTTGTLAEPERKQEALELVEILLERRALAQADRVIQFGLAFYPEELRFRLALARTLFLKGKADEAREELRPLLSSPSPPNEAFWFSGLVHLQQGEFSQALASFDTLVAREPLDASYHFGRGLALSGLLDYPGAVLALERAIEIDPRHGAASRQLTILYTRLDRNESAREALKKALALGPVPEPEIVPLARALRQSGLHQDARTVLRGARSPEARLELGLLDMEDGDYRRAADHLLAATAEPSTSTANTFYEYGRCLEHLGRLEQAIASYRRALEKEPRLAKASFRLGNLLLRLGQKEQGLALLDDYEEFRQWDRKVKQTVTEAMTSDNLTEAERKTKALEIVELYIEGGALDRAERAVQFGLASYPEEPLFRVALVQTLFLGGKREEAREELSSVLSAASPPAKAFWLSGLLHLSNGEISEAVEACRRGLEETPHLSVPFLEQLDSAYAMSDRVAQTETDFEETGRRVPTRAGTMADLATLLECLGRFDEAAARYREALEVDPGLIAARQGLARILPRLEKN
jgi:tetratricopeptide (TPR) repeat protein